LTDRIEEFTIVNKKIIYYDFSNFQNLDDYLTVIEAAKLGIVKYPKKSLLTMTNITNVRYDTRVKDAVAKWMEFNRPFVKCGAVFGVSGIKKITVNEMIAITGRSDIKYVHTKDQAIEWLLKQ
jgi:DUF2075 family protein